MSVDTTTAERRRTLFDLPERTSRWARSAAVYGIVVAGLAGVAGQWLGVSPPTAYGVCSACHGRDLADWILNRTEGAGLYVAAAGASWPILTVVGLVFGSFLAARRNGEFGSINLGGNVRQFLFGAIVMSAALFVSGCPTRLIIRTGYGDLAAAVGLGGVAIGVVIATATMRWVARR